jgi:hypothetical protein
VTRNANTVTCHGSPCEANIGAHTRGRARLREAVENSGGGKRVPSKTNLSSLMVLAIRFAWCSWSGHRRRFLFLHPSRPTKQDVT